MNGDREGLRSANHSHHQWLAKYSNAENCFPQYSSVSTPSTNPFPATYFHRTPLSIRTLDDSALTENAVHGPSTRSHLCLRRCVHAWALRVNYQKGWTMNVRSELRYDWLYLSNFKWTSKTSYLNFKYWNLEKHAVKLNRWSPTNVNFFSLTTIWLLNL